VPDDPPTERRYDKRGRDITASIAAHKAKNPKPASGTPAGGKGWGGPAKGFVPNETPIPPVSGARDLPRDPVTGRVLPTLESMQKAQIEEELKEFYLRVKRDENESTLNRLAGADKLFDRTSGKAPQTLQDGDGKPVAVVYRWAPESE